jgi:hypothetical protein
LTPRLMTTGPSISDVVLLMFLAPGGTDAAAEVAVVLIVHQRKVALSAPAGWRV